jgi:hypothetical protein
MTSLKFSAAMLTVALSTLFASCATWAADPASSANPCGKAVPTFEVSRADGTTILPDNDDEGTTIVKYSTLRTAAGGQDILLYCGKAPPVKLAKNFSACQFDITTKTVGCH